MCGATTEGVTQDGTEFTFTPGPRLSGGTYDLDIGTAGSATMLVLSVLPLACFADRPTRARIEGGVFQDFAPSPHHSQYVLAPLLRRMGASMSLAVSRPGYVPRGAGVIDLSLGADRAGAFRRSSEAIGTFVAKTLLQDLRSGATVDRHLADQLVLFAALARGASHYVVPRETEHLITNLWVIGQFGAGGTVEQRKVTIKGLGLSRNQTTEEAHMGQPAKGT
jgi:RNA 3'-terminal phosphate cyclase